MTPPTTSSARVIATVVSADRHSPHPAATPVVAGTVTVSISPPIICDLETLRHQPFGAYAFGRVYRLFTDRLRGAAVQMGFRQPATQDTINMFAKELRQAGHTRKFSIVGKGN